MRYACCSMLLVDFSTILHSLGDVSQIHSIDVLRLLTSHVTTRKSFGQGISLNKLNGKEHGPRTESDSPRLINDLF